jgi:hypothetical protein
MSMIREFREFAARGNVVDLAVGVIIGAAFGKIVTSLVNDIVMPPIGMAIGRIDFKSLFVALNRTRPKSRRARRRRRDPRRHLGLDARRARPATRGPSTSSRRRRSRRCSTRPTRSSPAARLPDQDRHLQLLEQRPHAAADQPYDRARDPRALARPAAPGGGTAIGDAMREARPDLYRAGVFRKYLLVVTDGENTNGRSPTTSRARSFARARAPCRSTSSRSTRAREVRVPEGGRRRRHRRRHRRRAADGARRHLPGQDPRRRRRRRRTGTGQEVTTS